MAQMTKALAEAILNGDGATRNEIEQLCHFFLSATEELNKYRQVKKSITPDQILFNTVQGIYDR